MHLKADNRFKCVHKRTNQRAPTAPHNPNPAAPPRPRRKKGLPSGRPRHWLIVFTGITPKMRQATATAPEPVEIPSAESLDIDTTITKDSLNDLPLFRFDGPVVIVSSDDEVPAAVKALRKETLLGFDTETRPSFRKGQNYPPALLQLAGSSTVYLFQLLRLKQLDPVLELLASPSICKVGVAIRDDIRKLREHHTFAPSGFLELSDSTQKAGVVNTGLRSLAGILLGIRISKGAQVSNWSRKELSESQVRYAATDAWISRMIHEKLVDLGLLLKDDSAA